MNLKTSKLIFALMIAINCYASCAQTQKTPTYEQWKQTKLTQWGKDSSFINNIQELFLQACLINLRLENMLQQCDTPIRLYAYNFLREIVGKSTVKSTDEIDETWFNHIGVQLSAVATKEEVTKQGLIFADPEPWQTTLIKEARKATNITTDQIIYSIKFPYDSNEDASFYVDQNSGATHTLFMIANTHKLDELLFDIYHELGHTKHNDADPVKILNKQYPAFEDEYYKTNNAKENFSNDFPKTNVHLELIKSYVERAKNALDTSTSAGKKILESISKVNSFWNISNSTSEIYIKIAIGRAQESRADLFACEHLFAQDKLDPILYTIRAWGTSDNLVSGADAHPSHVERALYMAGFLISKGVDINKALADFEHNWQPKDTRQLYNSDINQPGIENEDDLIKAYKKQVQPKKQDPVYENYKKQTNENFEQFEHPTVSKSAFKIAALYFNTWYEVTGLDMIKEKQDRRFKSTFTRVATTYNYLREFLNQPMIDTIDDIDRAWFNTALYELFKQEKRAEWRKRHMMNLFDFIKDLLSPEALTMSRMNHPGLIFFNYNFARELLGQPTTQLHIDHNDGPADMPFDLDQNWIDEQLKQ